MLITPASFSKVALLMGGLSPERDISLMSGRVVLEALKSKGIDVHPIDVGGDVIQQLQSLQPDRAFTILHGRGGEDGVMQGALELLGIPYTGSGVAACALAMDKQRSKWIWQRLGLPTLDFIAYDTARYAALTGSHLERTLKALGSEAIEKLGLPLCVKPIFGGSSQGVSRVNSLDDFAAAYHLAKQYDLFILVEPWIEGDEYTVCLLSQHRLPVIRIQSQQGFYDYQAKYFKNTTRYFCPSGLGSKEENELQELASQAFTSLGCSGWGRVDMLRDQEGKFWLLEVNAVPGMTTQSLMPKAAQAIGMSIADLVWAILLQSVRV